MDESHLLRGLRHLPARLYHYTSQAGLIGIVRNRCMWASDIRFMNDAKEVQHTIDIASTAIVTSLALGSAEENIQPMGGELQSLLIDFSKLPGMFVASLSEKGDLLSQWRGYCPPAGGYALGFDAQRLDAMLVDQKFILVPCLYDCDLQEAFIRNIVARGIEVLGQPRESDKAHSMKLKQLWIWADIAEFAPFTKHPSFFEECEWRIMPAPPNIAMRLMRVRVGGKLPSEYGNKIEWRGEGKLAVHYREGRCSLIPYITVPLEVGKQFPLVEIIIGPNPQAALALEALRGFLDSEGLVDVVLRTSQCPYRSF